MASVPALVPSASFREALRNRGGAAASRCYQCATCSSVCELTPSDTPFPRRQMLLAQWGLADELAADPAVWLCHQCNDCTVRCPRDARPGDVLSVVRGLLIERLAFPHALGTLVAKARTTWPLLLFGPVLFWAALLASLHLLAVVPRPLTAYEQIVPHWLIYAVFFPVAAWVLLASWISGRRLWRLLGTSGPRSGSFLAALVPSLVEVATHKRFASCEAARPRRTGHLALLWGFVGAAVTSGLLVVGIYLMGMKMPLPLDHPFKILGNVSAVLLVVGGVLLAANRLGDRQRMGAATAFDTFFLTVVLLVIATGVLAEAGRFLFSPTLAVGIYVAHLGFILTLFLTFPYSKFAHLLYRTLAMVHERMRTSPGTERPT